MNYKYLLCALVLLSFHSISQGLHLVVRLTQQLSNTSASSEHANQNITGEEIPRIEEPLAVGDDFRSMLFSSRHTCNQVGNVYLGEVFSCYISILNGTGEIVTEVDIQTNATRVLLPFKYQDTSLTLNAGQSVGDSISHEFPVLKPLDVCTKLCSAENDTVYLEAQVQNTTDADMIMERVALEPVPDLAPKNCCLIKPGAVRQFLYGISCIKQDVSWIAVAKLNMVWRTTNGRRGRVQTCPLQKTVSGCGDLKLKVISGPSAVKIRLPFHVVFQIQNCSERALQLTLTLDDTLQKGLLWNSLSEVQFEPLLPAKTMNVTLTLFAECAGLQFASGMKFYDCNTKRRYEYNDVFHVFVYT
ncbi:putative trafficking protein particle complex subunit 13 -like protein [Trichinella nativa]|uniref:Trafficking protein particle complex subunit 13-like protein n=1 Tax=Trichinella nativa TaxID=6335 RepID=A0A0V1KR91_9BILA|nr:putative trafficking protein particle complex subunit 13 -like protein [Trichinella nativa]